MSLFWFSLFVVAAFLVIVIRAEGDESIGYGAAFAINDGEASAFVVVPKVETLGVPNETTGIVESKRLDLEDAVIKKLPTLKNGGNFTVKVQLIAETWERLEAIRSARTEKQFRVSIPVDTGDLDIVVPGIITSNKVEDIEAENITVISCTIEVSGAQVSSGISSIEALESSAALPQVEVRSRLAKKAKAAKTAKKAGKKAEPVTAA